MKYHSLVELLQALASDCAGKQLYRLLNDKLEIENQLDMITLNTKARAIAAYLQEKSIHPNERALLVYPSGLDFITAFMGCLYAGVIVVPTSPPLNKTLMKRFHHISENATPHIILSNQTITQAIQRLKTKERFPLLRPILKLINKSRKKSLPHNIDYHEWVETDTLNTSLAEQFKPILIEPNNIAFIQYTSGSTRYPAGVMVTHANIMANAELFEKNFQLDTSSTGLSWLPLYHDMGLIGNVLQALYSRFTLYLMSPLSFIHHPLLWLQGIDRYRVTISGAPDFAYALATRDAKLTKELQLDLHRWKTAYCGAEPIHPETLRNFYKTFKPYLFNKESLAPCYGMAEATLYISGNQHNYEETLLKVDKSNLQKNIISLSEKNNNYQTIVSVGSPALHVKIVDPKTKQICKDDEVGEIWCSGRSVGLGYWQAPQSTETIFKAKLSQDDGHYYLRTADLGFLHQGKLYVTGRLKDIIDINGCKYYPQDIEKTVAKSSSKIKSGKVVALEVNSPEGSVLNIIAGVTDIQLSNTEKAHIASLIDEAIVEKHGIIAEKIMLVPANAIKKTTSGKLQRYRMKCNLLANKLPLLFILQPRVHRDQH